MLFQRTITLLYLSRERLVRADFSARGRQLGFWTRSRPAAAEIPTLVDTAARLCKKRPGKVFVLSDEFWSHKVSVPGEVLLGLGPKEISRALAFEAESLSGISAVDSDLEHVSLGSKDGREEFWAVQIPAWIRRQCEECISRAGGQLAGLVHPGGLPLPLAAVAPSGGWRRLEAWSGIVMGVGAEPGGGIRTTLQSADSRNASAVRGLEAWSQSFGNSASLEQLTEGQRPAPLTTVDPPLNLSHNETLTLWLGFWAKSLSASGRQVPCVVPPKRPLSGKQRATISAALALAVAGIVAADAWRTFGKLDSLDGEIAAIKQKSEELAGIKKEMADIEKKTQEVKKQVQRLGQDVPQTEASVLAYRRRWTELLTAVAEESSTDLVIREISGKGGNPAIHGVSLGKQPLDAFASSLAARMRPYGWTVSKSSKSLPAGEASAYEFSLHLVESPIASPADSNAAGVAGALIPPASSQVPTAAVRTH